MYIYGFKARYWSKFYYKSKDGFILTRLGNVVVDLVFKDWRG
ncbi:hypothetical protein [Campylobacter gastrosuis]|uniref:Uncharacterized protein n=1 Tax=Campylobacter gastrosuis TaxID=2974576 RepID=A0ABT7HU65_9BACT|nr:hypothetical protein [Campylobacter gastrosuis]MDL0089929.1 hypothetical protein [Campylobacter gastrosuis]